MAESKKFPKRGHVRRLLKDMSFSHFLGASEMGREQTGRARHVWKPRGPTGVPGVKLWGWGGGRGSTTDHKWDWNNRTSDSKPRRLNFNMEPVANLWEIFNSGVTWPLCVFKDGEKNLMETKLQAESWGKYKEPEHTTGMKMKRWEKERHQDRGQDLVASGWGAG